MFNRLTTAAETRRRVQVLVNKYNNFERSTASSYPEYEDVNMLVIMLNADDELADLVTMSGVDEICELSPAEKNCCRTSLHFNREFRLHEKLNARLQGDDHIMRVIDKDYPCQAKRHTNNMYNAILHCDWFGRDSKKVPQKFLSAITGFLSRIQTKLTKDLLLGKRMSSQEHRHAFQEVFLVPERFGRDVVPVEEDRISAESRALNSLGVAGVLAIMKGVKFEYATYKYFYECACGKEHYHESVGLL